MTEEEYTIYFDDWGRIEYDRAWERQTEIFSGCVDRKLHGENMCGYWIMCEHPPVVTLGKHGKKSHLLCPPDWLAARGIGYVETDRGGDITYHGDGQLVCYPILDLERLHLGLREYIDRLEEVVIHLLSRFGIAGGRVKGATGVWLDAGTASERKICAMGVRSSRYVTMHGLALNVNTDLAYFSYIHPCGFTDRGVTSMARELGGMLDMSLVRRLMREEVCRLFPAGSSE